MHRVIAVLMSLGTYVNFYAVLCKPSEASPIRLFHRIE
jgi:hypothetical protein